MHVCMRVCMYVCHIRVPTCVHTHIPRLENQHKSTRCKHSAMSADAPMKKAKVHVNEPSSSSNSTKSPPLWTKLIYNVFCFNDSDSDSDNVIHDSDREEEQPPPPATADVTEPSSSNVQRCGVGGTILLWR